VIAASFVPESVILHFIFISKEESFHHKVRTKVASFLHHHHLVILTTRKTTYGGSMLWRISSTSETRGVRFHETGYAGFPLLLILYFALVIGNRYREKVERLCRIYVANRIISVELSHKITRIRAITPDNALASLVSAHALDAEIAIWLIVIQRFDWSISANLQIETSVSNTRHELYAFSYDQTPLFCRENSTAFSIQRSDPPCGAACWLFTTM